MSRPAHQEMMDQIVKETQSDLEKEKQKVIKAEKAVAAKDKELVMTEVLKTELEYDLKKARQNLAHLLVIDQSNDTDGKKAMVHVVLKNKKLEEENKEQSQLIKHLQQTAASNKHIGFKIYENVASMFENLKSAQRVSKAKLSDEFKNFVSTAHTTAARQEGVDPDFVQLFAQEKRRLQLKKKFSKSSLGSIKNYGQKKGKTKNT